MADQAGVPPYVIFPDKSLKEMARTMPRDLQNFRNICGVGEIKQEKYGPVFTSAIKNFCDGTKSEIKQPDSREEILC